MKTKDITLTGLMAALIFIGTFFFKIPSPFGYNHFGDGFMLLTVFMLGYKKGAFAGAIGAGLADLIGGYTVWVLPTIVIKSMGALFIGLVKVKRGKINKIMRYVGVGVGAIFHICAYTFVRIFLYGISAALVALPGLIFQTVSGVVIFVALYVCVSKAGIKKVFAN